MQRGETKEDSKIAVPLSVLQWRSKDKKVVLKTQGQCKTLTKADSEEGREQFGDSMSINTVVKKVQCDHSESSDKFQDIFPFHLILPL